MFHFSVRVFGRSYALQHDDTWAGRGLPLLWTTKHTGKGGEYHCGNCVLYVARVDSGSRVELKLGRLALSL